uniref:Uncharacterized protein n=1 Tax=Romanomermis culicivorax TaxID=13658 RepID=A0A915KX20_ROMCU
MSFNRCERTVRFLVIQKLRAMELVKRLIDHGRRDDQLLDLFDLAIQKSIFGKENCRRLCGIVYLKISDNFGHCGVGSLCLSNFRMGGNGYGFNQRWPVVGGQ